MTGHSDTSTHGYEAKRAAPVLRSPGRVLTRAEIVGLADQERKINALYNHGDQPSDLYWQRELAKLDAALATQGAAA